MKITDFAQMVERFERLNSIHPKTDMPIVMTTKQARKLLAEIQRLQEENEAYEHIHNDHLEGMQ